MKPANKKFIEYISYFLAFYVLAYVVAFQTGNVEELNTFAEDGHLFDLSVAVFIAIFLGRKGFYQFLWGFRKRSYVFVCASTPTRDGKTEYTPIYSFQGSGIHEAPDWSLIKYLHGLSDSDLFDNKLKIVTMKIRPSISSFVNSWKSFKI
jgi:hypothetical protein